MRHIFWKMRKRKARESGSVGDVRITNTKQTEGKGIKDAGDSENDFSGNDSGMSLTAPCISADELI